MQWNIDELRTNEVLLHGKFQPPSSNGVVVHKLQTEVQTKKGAFKYMVRFLTVKYRLFENFPSQKQFLENLKTSLDFCVVVTIRKKIKSSFLL